MDVTGLDEIQKRFTKEIPESLSKYIGEIFANAIVEGKIKGGQKLVENEIQKRLGVSRSPIREAFRILERKGLVVNVPRKGTYVRKISENDIKENFPIRAYLEGLAARLAVPNLSPNDIAKMESDLEIVIKSAKLKDYKTYLKHHSNFHETFIRASKNTTLIEFLENLRRQSIWFRFTYFYVIDSSEVAIRAHSEILELFKKKDVEKVEFLVRNHILLALDGFIQFIKKEEKTDRKP
ncbi:MAG: GntR family transcriptional regulator [Thermodesulfobacteriota bacterium]